MRVLRFILLFTILILLYQNCADTMSTQMETTISDGEITHFKSASVQATDPGLFGDLSHKWNTRSYKDYYGRSVLDLKFKSSGAAFGEYHISYEPPVEKELAWTSETNHPLAGTIIAMIDNVPKGSLIRISMYKFTNQNYAKAIIRAISRGVKVRIILSNSGQIATASSDSSRAKIIMDNIIAAQNKSGVEGHWFIVCQKGSGGACISDGKNHNKYLLFSRICRNGVKSNGKCARSPDSNLSYYEDIVMQTSLNLTYDQLNSYNTGTVLIGNRKIYETYFKYFNYKAYYAPVGPKTNFKFSVALPQTEGTHFTFHGLPRLKKDTVADDALISEISKVTCRVAQYNGKTYPTIIRISNAHWTASSRGTMIVNKLSELQKQGCDIRILGSASLSDYPSAKYKPTHDKIMQAGLNIKSFIKTKNSYGDLHAKYMVIEEPQQLKNAVTTVMYGSMSFTNPAQTRNDETWIVWKNPSQAMTKFYRSSFDAIWNSLPDVYHLVKGGCAINQDNKGCTASVRCDSGSVPVAVKVACNLETKGYQADLKPHLNNADWNTMTVAIESNNESACSFNGQTISKDAASIKPSERMTLSCSEEEKSGGDCRILALVKCRVKQW